MLNFSIIQKIHEKLKWNCNKLRQYLIPKRLFNNRHCQKPIDHSKISNPTDCIALEETNSGDFELNFIYTLFFYCFFLIACNYTCRWLFGLCDCVYNFHNWRTFIRVRSDNSSTVTDWLSHILFESILFVYGQVISVLNRWRNVNSIQLRVCFVVFLPNYLIEFDNANARSITVDIFAWDQREIDQHTGK